MSTAPISTATADAVIGGGGLEGTPTAWAPAAEKMAHRFPGLTLASIASTYAGCYDVTPDCSPVISRTPVAGLIAAVGFSGHGFTISPSVGQLIADLIIDGMSSDPGIPESDFRLSRFAEGDRRRRPHPYDGAGEMR